MEDQVTIEKLKEDNRDYWSDDFKVSIGENRIFTASTDCTSTISKYIGDMKKLHQRISNNKNKQQHRPPIVIGFSADLQNQGIKECPYDILTLCVDSQCLMVIISNIVDFNSHLQRNDFPNSLKDLLTDSNTILVGIGIEKVAQKFEKDFGFQLGKRVDLKSLAIEGLLRDKDEDEDEKEFRRKLRRLPLDDLLNKALGRREFKIRRQTKKVEMWSDWYYSLHEDRVKHSTLDGFVAWKIGTKYLDMIKNKFLV